MEIVAALFVEGIDFRQVAGPSTRIDITGAFFSMASPAPVPVTLEPHLLVLVRCHPDEPGDGILEVVFKRGDEQVARNVSPFNVEPGKFTYRLVRAELEFTDYGTVDAYCRLGPGEPTIVPLTLLPPA